MLIFFLDVAILLIIIVLFFLFYNANKKMIYKPDIIEQQVIELNHHTYDPRLFSRKLWQVLFPAFIKYGDIRDIDEFLCDLKLFETFFIAAIEKSTFYWGIKKGGVGYWTTTTDNVAMIEQCDCAYAIRIVTNYPHRKLDITLIQENVQCFG